jgi:hypothetical protein
LGGEEADCLDHSWLEKTSVDRVRAAVRGEGLAVGEETRQESGGRYIRIGVSNNRRCANLF